MITHNHLIIETLDIDYFQRAQRAMDDSVPLKVDLMVSGWSFNNGTYRIEMQVVFPIEFADKRTERIDASIAKQLQTWMERNARMVNRFRRLLDKPVCSREVVHDELRSAVESILKDEEPRTWPAV